MKSKMEKSKILAFLLNEYSCLYIMTLLIDNFFFYETRHKKVTFFTSSFFLAGNIHKNRLFLI